MGNHIHWGQHQLSGLLAVVVGLLPTASMAGGWYVAPDFTLTHLDSDSYEGSESSLGISLGKRFSAARDIEVSYAKQMLQLQDIPDRLRRKEFLISGRWSPDLQDTPNLFMSAGVGGAQLKYLQDNFFAPTAFAGLGYRFSMPWTSKFDVLAEGRLRYSRIDDAPGQKDVTDTQAVLKVRYTFSPASINTAIGTPDPVNPYPENTVDGNRSDRRELCKSLPRSSDGFRGYQCELFDDTDSDGVPDTKDLCRNTIPAVSVDVEGCMIQQSTPPP